MTRTPLTKAQHIARNRAAAEAAAHLHPTIDSEKSFMTQHSEAREHEGDIIGAVNPAEIADELEAGEFLKKPEVLQLGAFNIISARTRKDRYRGRDIDQIIFELQFLQGKSRGARAYVSFESNVVREKLYDAVKRHGAVGPYILDKMENDKGEVYTFVPWTATATAPENDTNAQENDTATAPANPSRQRATGSAAAKRGKASAAASEGSEAGGEDLPF